MVLWNLVVALCVGLPTAVGVAWAWRAFRQRPDEREWKENDPGPRRISELFTVDQPERPFMSQESYH